MLLNTDALNKTPLNQAGGGGGIYQPSWGLSLQVVPLTVQPSWGLALQVWGTVQPSWGLRLQVLDQTAMLTGLEDGWGYRASIGGVDVSSRLIGPMRVRGEEGLAATASCSLKPVSGPVDLTAWVGDDIALEYVWIDPTGTIEQVAPMFVGVVDAVAIDAASGVLTLTAVDRRAEILAAGGAALLPGSKWSAGVFDEGGDAAQRQDDRLTTLCASFDIDQTGAPCLSDWAAKAVADWSIGADDYVWGSLRVDLASHKDIVQRVECAFDYRFPRLRLRETWMTYEFGGATALAADPICPPSVSMIAEAIDNTGLDVLEAPNYNCMSVEWKEIGGVWHRYPGFESMVLNADVRLGRRFAQSIEEQYTLTVDCAEVGIDPRRLAEVRGAMESNFDAAAWEDDPNASPVLSRPYLAVETLHDAVTDADTGRGAAEVAIEVLLAQAKALIRGSHRSNRLTFSSRLNPFINRTHTVAFDAAGWAAQGKVFAFEHELDPGTGPGTLGARTTITLAVSKPSLTNPTPSALAAPAAPAAPAMDVETQQAHRLILGNHVGAKATSAPWDEATMQGYIVNIPSGTFVDGMVTGWGYGAMVGQPSLLGADSWSPGQPYPLQSGAEGSSHYSGEVVNPDFVAENGYPWQFRIISPEVETEARDNATEAVEDTYLVDVPDDLFAYTAP